LGVIANVKAGIAPAGASALLGQSFLQQLKSWSIDNAGHELMLEQQAPVQAAK
jgi:predicted aspartyl protease